jgi:hypothetical protein
MQRGFFFSSKSAKRFCVFRKQMLFRGFPRRQFSLLSLQHLQSFFREAL